MLNKKDFLACTFHFNQTFYFSIGDSTWFVGTCYRWRQNGSVGQYSLDELMFKGKNMGRVTLRRS
jgi:hypothetical protein